MALVWAAPKSSLQLQSLAEEPADPVCCPKQRLGLRPWIECLLAPLVLGWSGLATCWWAGLAMVMARINSVGVAWGETGTSERCLYVTSSLVYEWPLSAD